MKRKFKQSFELNNNNTSFYSKMLNWVDQFNIFCLLDSNENLYTKTNYNIVLGVEAIEIFCSNTNGLDVLQQLHNYNDWLMGNINFELQQETEGIFSAKKNNIEFPLVHFFCPKILLQLENGIVHIESTENNTSAIFNAINTFTVKETNSNFVNSKPKQTKEEYITIINKIKEHIKAGDCYELNYCTEFYDENARLNTVATYLKLKQASPTPFHCFYKVNNQYLLCASPERYLKKTGTTLLSQPIKGTIKRNNVSDDAQIEMLKKSHKDVSENVMVVDLVRNDLSKICKKKSVTVSELLKVYSFPQVHHLISTVQGEVVETVSLAQIIKATFPMGSMTGAPKHKVLQLTQLYELSARGLYSGTVGYIAPNGDFDFNVVIRSILYNANNQYLQYLVGGGITINSQAEDEYLECLLKAKAMVGVL